jgi:hypothetical protein
MTTSIPSPEDLLEPTEADRVVFPVTAGDPAHRLAVA